MKHGFMLMATIAIAFAVSLTGASVWESDGAPDTVVVDGMTFTIQLDGNAALTSIGKNYGEITVPDTVYKDGHECKVTMVSLSDEPDVITKIVLPGSVFEIEAQSFYHMTNLKEVVFGEGLGIIGNGAFAFTGISTFDLPESLGRIDNGAFSGTPIESITIPKNVEMLSGGAFTACEQLKSITIDPENQYFEIVGDCILTKDGSSLVYHIQGAKECVIPDGVEKIEPNAFNGDVYLESVMFPDSLESFGMYAFDYCISLKSITLPEKVQDLPKGVFRQCLSLEEVTLNDGLVSIETQAFSGCASLTSIHLNKSLQTMEICFDGCKNMSSVTVSPENMHFAAVDDVLYTKDLKELIWYPEGRTDAAFHVPEGTESIHGYAFYATKHLEEVYIPESVEMIYGSAFEQSGVAIVQLPESLRALQPDTFSGCINLAEINIPRNLEAIGSGAFANCMSLTSMDLPDTVTVLESKAFFGCSSLEHVTFDVQIDRLPVGAFMGCSSLVEVTIPDQIMVLEDACFANCTSLTTVYMGELLNLNYTHVSTPFEGCISLENIILSDKNVDMCVVDGVLFSKDMETLLLFPTGDERQDYRIPDSVKLVGTSAFAYAKNLVNLSMSNVEEIGIRAFENCSGLVTIDMGADIVAVNDGAFMRCDSLQTISVSSDSKIAKVVDGALILDGYILAAYPAKRTASTYTIPSGIETVSYGAFSGNEYLKHVDGGEDVVNYANFSFYNCISLESVVLSEKTTALGQSCFENCVSLKSIDLPASTLYVFSNAFMNCSGLEKVTIHDFIKFIYSPAFATGANAETGEVTPMKVDFFVPTGFVIPALQLMYGGEVATIPVYHSVEPAQDYTMIVIGVIIVILILIVAAYFVKKNKH